MALTWLWDNKCGEAVFKRKRAIDSPKDDTVKTVYKTEEYTVNLYEGNAELIFIYEYEKDGKQMYDVMGFFADKEHMKRCLGIDKRYKETYGYNMYEKDYDRLAKIRFNKAKSRHYEEIIKAFVQAFKNIEIEVYSEEANN